MWQQNMAHEKASLEDYLQRHQIWRLQDEESMESRFNSAELEFFDLWQGEQEKIKREKQQLSSEEQHECVPSARRSSRSPNSQDVRIQPTPGVRAGCL